MIYIDKTPNPSGAYPNPKNQPFPYCIPLSDEQAKIFFEYNGFVTVTAEGDTVTVEPNTEAYQAYIASFPEPSDPDEQTPEQRREEAYNTQAIIPWCGDMLTVTAAAQLWQYYAAEGSDKASELTALIASAKEKIREQYPDTEAVPEVGIADEMQGGGGVTTAEEFEQITGQYYTEG